MEKSTWSFGDIVIAILLILTLMNLFGLVVFAAKIIGLILVVWFVVSFARSLVGSDENK